MEVMMRVNVFKKDGMVKLTSRIVLSEKETTLKTSLFQHEMLEDEWSGKEESDVKTTVMKNVEYFQSLTLAAIHDILKETEDE